MNKIIFGAIILFVLISFQNCKTNSKLNEALNASQSGHGIQYESGGDIAQVKLGTVTEISFLSDKERNSQYFVEVERGVLTKKSHDGSTEIVSCLSSAGLAKVNDFLNKASVCVSIKEFSGNVMCTQEYVKPNLILLVNGNELKLGERFSSCDIPTELCNGMGEQILDILLTDPLPCK